MRQLAKLFLFSSLLALASTVMAKEPLRVGLSPDYPPLAYKEDGQLTGIDVAAAEVLGKQLDRKVEYTELPFGQLIPALEAGKIDIIMSGMTITTERSQKVSFSKPYLNAGQMAIIRFADAGRFGYKGAMFRPGARVAVQAGTTSETYGAEHLKKAVLTRCNTSEEAFAMLKSGKVDFFIHDAATSWSLATDKTKQDFMSIPNELTDEQLGWAVNKNNAALLQSVNQQLAIMQKNGMLRAIIKQWIPVTVEVVEGNSVKVPDNLPTTPPPATRKSNGRSQ
jgi:polar amino acid transport system substrate-binding protein